MTGGIHDGSVPDGWQVHHKLPLDDSGTNLFDNLVLIQNEPYHKVITNYQNSVVRQMEIGKVQAVQWPIKHVDDALALKKVNYQEVLKLRKTNKV